VRGNTTAWRQRPALGNAGDSLWQACVDQLAQELPEQQFNTWIKPLAAQVPTTFPGHAVRGQPLQARLGPRPVRRPHRRHAGKLYGQPVQLS
jgi:chromosomal replication initiator protein